MTNELRKELRLAFAKLHETRMCLDALWTPGNLEILSKHPYFEKEGKNTWSHPLTHYQQIIDKELITASKLLDRLITSLPRERKKKGENPVKSTKKRNRRSKAEIEASRAADPGPPAGVRVEPETNKKGRKPKKS